MSPRDEITCIKWTVAMEAEGEPMEGKVAVAYTIMNRVRQWKQSVSDVCFRAWQFSAWNTDSPTRMRLDQISDEIMDDSERAATIAYYEQEPDPTDGAVYYMNVDLVRRQRGGKLPRWWNEGTDSASQVNIGEHSFRKAK